MPLRAWLWFAGVAVLWGIPYFLIKIAVGEVSPPVVAFARLGLGAACLIPVAAARGALRPALPRWPWWTALGLGYLAFALTLIPVAETFVSSSITAILIAAVPITVAVISLRWERPGRLEVAGLLIGFAGVAALVGIDLGGRPSQLVGAGLLILVTVAYALGPIMTSRRLGGLDPLGYTSLAMLVAVVALLPLVAWKWPAHVPSSPVLLSLAALGILCTAIPYALYFSLIQAAGPQRATLVTYFNPLVAVLLGVAFLHERLGPAAIAGMALILAGSFLATRGRARARSYGGRHEEERAPGHAQALAGKGAGDVRQGP